MSVSDETLVVCRCEAVTLGHLRRAATDLDVRTVRQWKLVTRAGMGICQGRVCRPAIEGLGRTLGLDVAPDELRTRPPLRPVTFATLAGEGQA